MTLAASQKMIDDFDTAAVVAGDLDNFDSESQLLEVDEEKEEDDEAHSRLCVRKRLSLPGLTRAILRYFKYSTMEEAELSNIDPDPLIYVYDSLRLIQPNYPSWIEEEIGIQISTTDPNSNLRVPSIEHYLLGSAKMISERIKCASTGKGRRDAGLVTRPTQ